MRLMPRRSRADEEPAGTMTVIEHLTELRRRLIISMWAIGVGAIAGFFLWDPFIDLIQEPYCDFIETHPAQAPDSGCGLVFLGPFDGFTVRMKTTLFLGLAVALPVVLFQLWAFIVPGLTAKEKRWSIPFVVSSFVLFVAGGVLAYFVLPKSLDFLLSFAGEAATPVLTIDRYVGFVTLLTLAFGLSFLFPVILVFLELIGVVTPQTLGRYRRYAILVISIFAALITPGTDVVSMVAMMIPMYLFYEAAIIIGRLVKKERS